MKKRMLLLSLVVVLLFAGQALGAPSKVWIGNVLVPDPVSDEKMRNEANTFLRANGFEVVRSKSEADYQLNISLLSMDKTGSINWWIIVVPLWPILGVSQGEIAATVEVVALKDGVISWNSRETSSFKEPIWFADFIPMEKYYNKTAIEALKRALRSFITYTQSY